MVGGNVLLNKGFLLKEISSSLAKLRAYVEIVNTINFYDINIVAEDFFAGLLNLVYDIELKNINHTEKNASSIDLGDDSKRLSVQVTSDNTSTKISHSIDEFIEDKWYEKYDRLIVFMLKNKKNYSTNFDTKGKFSFSKKGDILDINDLITIISNFSVEKLKKIDEYLSQEFVDKEQRVPYTEAGEVESIMDLIEYITKQKGRVYSDLKESFVDPNYKFDKRFKDFAGELKEIYRELSPNYLGALQEVYNLRGEDDAEDIDCKIFLQDLSKKYLSEAKDNPVLAINGMVDYFAEKLRNNGKKYNMAAIKFYLIDKMIACSVFPNPVNGGAV